MRAPILHLAAAGAALALAARAATARAPAATSTRAASRTDRIGNAGARIACALKS